MRVRKCDFCNEHVVLKYKLLVMDLSPKGYANVKSDAKDICTSCAAKKLGAKHWKDALEKFKSEKDNRGRKKQSED